MSGGDLDPGEHLRDELDELHERLAALTARVADLERDRDTLLAEAESQAERMRRAEVKARRVRLSLRKLAPPQHPTPQGEDPPATLPDAE